MKKTKTIEKLTSSGYYYVNTNITTNNFPVPKKVETEGYRMIPLDGYKSSEEYLEIIRQARCRPANVYELALLRENHPETFVVGKWHVALGSTWTDSDGHRRVPYVVADAAGDFEFHLVAWDGDWLSDYALVCFCDNQHFDTLALTSDSESLTLSDETKNAITLDAEIATPGIKQK